MFRDLERRNRRGDGALGAPAEHRRMPTRIPVVERLEGRQLLSHFFSGATAVRPIQTPGGVYTVTMNGPGLANVSQLGRGVVALKLYGTTSATSVNIALTYQRLHKPLAPLKIGSIKVLSGQVGAINAGNASLLGTVTPLNGSVNALQFGDLGPNARIDVSGSLGSLGVGAVDLGPNGHVKIAGDLSQTLSVVGPMSIEGGQFVVGHDLTGGGTVGGDLSITQHGLFAVGQDLNGTLAVTGNLLLSSNGTLSVGRDLNILTVNGNLVVDPSGGQIVVGGNLYALIVNGFFQGKGTPEPADLVVGLDLNHLFVNGGGANLGGLRNASIDVAKCIQVDDVADPLGSVALGVKHGIFDSLITAGICIDGVATGADGVIAVQNSQFLAGRYIRDVSLNGDLKSDFPTNPNPAGYPTRVIAGELRSGQFSAGGDISNFVVTGALIDSVLAASVQPYGGDGSLPPAVPYGALPRQPAPPPGTGDSGFNTYDAPAGVTGSGTGAYKNYSELSFPGSGPPAYTTFYDTTADPTIDDNILPGGTITATVTGGVISTPHGDNFDFAGVFAEKTQGVQGGPLP
jgi:hypothetical protein